MAWGAAAAAAGDIVGSIFGKNTADADRRAQVAMANDNIALEREFAQNGIRWKVEDAKAAGIHPLYALGANTQSFSPVSIASNPNDGVGNHISRMGQNIGRAIDAAANEEERRQTLKMNQLQLENQSLQNDILRSQLSSINNPASVSLPSNSGIGSGLTSRSAYVNENPLSRIHSAPNKPQSEVGAVSDYGLARTKTGLAIIPSKDVKERIEDTFLPEMSWSIRNQILPGLGVSPTPPSTKEFPLPDGMEWRWIPFPISEFQPRPKKGRYVMKF